MPRIKRTSYLEFWPKPAEPAPPEPAAEPSIAILVDSLSQLETQPLTAEDMERWARQFGGITGLVTGRMSSGRRNQEQPEIQRIPINELRGAIAANPRADDPMFRAMRHGLLYGVLPPLRVSLERDQAREADDIRARINGQMRRYVEMDLEAADLRWLGNLHDTAMYEAVLLEDAPVPTQEAEPEQPRTDPKQRRYNYYEERQRHGRAPPQPSSLLSKLTRRING
jgi:hypothetical protein